MTAPPLHVVFNPSAAGGLRKALGEAGRGDRVVSFFDDLSFGPINLPDPETRRQWVEEELGYAGWDDATNTDAFWREALEPSPKIAWISRRTTQEYTGFLEWLRRLGAAPCQIIDLTDVTVLDRRQNRQAKPMLAVSLAVLPPYQILESGLFERSEPLALAARDRYLDMWRYLQDENAPLRVLNEDGTLVSAPISFFDSMLLSYATYNWRKAAIVVAHGLAKFWDDSLVQTGDLMLAARIRALVRAGFLEAQGDVDDLRYSEVRLASKGR